MKVSVLGATRRTGRLVVDELLRRGHAVVALVRDPAGGALPDRVQVHAGHARDAATLQALVSGSDPDRTLVRPSRPVDTPGTGQVRHSAHRSPRSTRISRHDLAGFVVGCLESGSHPRQAPLVGQA